MKLAFILILVSVSVSVFAQGTTDCRTLHCYENGQGVLGNEVACPSGYSFPQACFNMYPGVAVCDEPAGASFIACLICYPPFGFVFFQICNSGTVPPPNTPPSNTPPPPPNTPPSNTLPPPPSTVPPSTVQPCPEDSPPWRLCDGFEILDKLHTALCGFDNLPRPFIYGIAAILVLELPLFPVELLLENLFEICAAWVEVGGEAVDLTSTACEAAKSLCKPPILKKSLAFDQDVDHILARQTKDLNPCNDWAQNLTSILSSFNFSAVTADCANLTANAQSFETSGIISADNANKLISTCVKVENNAKLTTAFINNATFLTQHLQSLVQNCTCPTVPDGTIRNATCYIESCPSGHSISSNHFSCV